MLTKLGHRTQTAATMTFATNMCTFNLAATASNNNLAVGAVCPVSANTRIKSYKEIPGPKTLPVLGSLFNIKSFGGNYDFMEFRDFQDHLQADFGDLVKWEIFNYKFVSDCINIEYLYLIKKEYFLSLFLIHFLKVYVFNPEHIKEIYKADNSTPFRPTADPMVKLHQNIGIKLDLINR